MSNPDKPFKTFEELREILTTGHNLISCVNDPNALEILKFIPYYDLVNGYKEAFMVNDKFKPNTTIDKLFLFHIFDRAFESALFESSVYIENYFKNILAYVIAKNYDVIETKYLDINNFRLPQLKKLGKSGAKSKRGKIIKGIQAELSDTTDNPTAFYRSHHNHVPPWILFKNITFSQSIGLFEILPKTPRDEAINILLPYKSPSSPQITSDQLFPILLYFLTLIRKGRNQIAHNLKFISLDCSKYMNNLNKAALRQIIPQTLLSDPELKSYTYLNGIYGYIMVSLILISINVVKAYFINRVNSALSLQGVFDQKEFINTGNFIKNSYFQAANIPADIQTRLLNYMKNL